jgi:hypothetical protein
MLILTEYNAPYIIWSMTAPCVAKYSWIFAGDIQDFRLSPISYLEETTGPVIEVMVNKFKFRIPASWYILICDQDTMLVDTIQVSAISGSTHQALLMSPTSSNLYLDEVKIIDYIPQDTSYHASIAKGTMLCHPVGPVMDNKQDVIYSCMIGPYDMYKYIQGMTAKELIL